MTKQTPAEQLAAMYDEYVELCAKAEQPVKNYHEWDEFGGWMQHRYQLLSECVVCRTKDILDMWGKCTFCGEDSDESESS